MATNRFLYCVSRPQSAMPKPAHGITQCYLPPCMLPSRRKTWAQVQCSLLHQSPWLTYYILYAPHFTYPERIECSQHACSGSWTRTLSHEKSNLIPLCHTSRRLYCTYHNTCTDSDSSTAVGVGDDVTVSDGQKSDGDKPHRVEQIAVFRIVIADKTSTIPVFIKYMQLTDSTIKRYWKRSHTHL